MDKIIRFFRKKSQMLLLCALFFLLIISIFFLIQSLILIVDPFRNDLIYFQQIKVGMSEKEVLSLIGTPYKTFSSVNQSNLNYYVYGWSYKKKKIKHKVLIYIKGDKICYVYLDKNNKVEDIFIGGS